MKLIVGLGNPGKKYSNQRHNLGFMVIDRLAESLNTDISNNKFKADYEKTSLGGESVILAKPMTYMNLSGHAVQGLASFYKVEFSEILIVCDDLNIDFGRIRIRKKGSDGGHNGLKSIITCLGSQNFPRLRLGVGLPNGSGDVSNYVLSQFGGQDKKDLDSFIERAKDAVLGFITDSIQSAMNQYNS